MAVACPTASLQWFALKVRTRAEKTAEDALARRGFETLAPTFVERRKYSDRVKEKQAPLFPGYVFCKLNWNDRLPVLSTPNVEYIVGFGTEPTPVPQTELEAVKAVAESAACSPHPFLRLGQRVRLLSGPLADIEGILVGTRPNQRLVVSVELLQRSVAAEIDAAAVRVI
jgi:transcription antitermination factor NusG